MSKMRNRVNIEIEIPFQIANDGVLMMGRCMYMPNNTIIKQKILQEAHESKFTIHPGSIEIYQDLKQYYWWSNVKIEVANYMTKCGICQ